MAPWRCGNFSLRALGLANTPEHADGQRRGPAPLGACRRPMPCQEGEVPRLNHLVSTFSSNAPRARPPTLGVRRRRAPKQDQKQTCSISALVLSSFIEALWPNIVMALYSYALYSYGPRGPEATWHPFAYTVMALYSYGI